jgi:hypothetical protein
MKQLNPWSVGALGLVLSALVQAQPPGSGIARLDTDGDGLVSRLEFSEGDARRGPKIFDYADGNGDGVVSLEELQAAVDERAEEKRAQAAEHMQTMFEAMDGNNDGLVTREEAEAHVFARIDSDGDGFISEDEAREMKDRRGGRRERRRDRDGEGA